jgi:hypothetical protein
MIREAVAMKPMVQEKASAMMMDVMPVAPPTDCVADQKTSIKGKPMVA